MNKSDFQRIESISQSFMKTLTKEACREYAFAYGLFTRNEKLMKGDNFNIGLELLPSTLSGKNLCPNAGDCKYSCIAFIGLGNILTGKKMIETGEINHIMRAKAIRTWLYLNDKEFFFDVLGIEIDSYYRISNLKGKKLAIRMNTTSDINFNNFIKKFPNIQFFDYTKVWNKPELENYHLTYSASEKTSPKKIIDFLGKGKNVAMVFHKVPTDYNGYTVVNGDENDNRYDNEKGVVIGLKYKTPIGGKKIDTFVFG